MAKSKPWPRGPQPRRIENPDNPKQFVVMPVEAEHQTVEVEHQDGTAQLQTRLGAIEQALADMAATLTRIDKRHNHLD